MLYYIMVKYSVIESDSNPFSDYFKEDNPSYHEKIQRHYVKTVELVLGHNKSVLLTELRTKIVELSECCICLWL